MSPPVKLEVTGRTVKEALSIWKRERLQKSSRQRSQPCSGVAGHREHRGSRSI